MAELISEKKKVKLISDDIKSKIREICSKFQYKLPESAKTLLIFSSYAEKIINRYEVFDGHNETELKNINLIWDGFYAIFQDNCEKLNVGREIEEQGSELNSMVVQYIFHMISNIERTGSEKDLQWIYEWLTSLDCTKVDPIGLTNNSMDFLFHAQKLANNVVNDIMATCTGNDINTANMINVYRDKDMVKSFIEIYRENDMYLAGFKESTRGTPFQFSVYLDNFNKFFAIVLGKKRW